MCYVSVCALALSKKNITSTANIAKRQNRLIVITKLAEYQKRAKRESQVSQIAISICFIVFYRVTFIVTGDKVTAANYYAVSMDNNLSDT